MGDYFRSRKLIKGKVTKCRYCGRELVKPPHTGGAMPTRCTPHKGDPECAKQSELLRRKEYAAMLSKQRLKEVNAKRRELGQPLLR